MRKAIMLMMLVLMAGCVTFEAGKVSEERKELYTHNNDKEFCRNNPDKCINDIPWM